MRYEVRVELEGSPVVRDALEAEVRFYAERVSEITARPADVVTGDRPFLAPAWGPMVGGDPHLTCPPQPHLEGRVAWSVWGEADNAWEAQEMALAHLDEVVKAFDVRAAFREAHGWLVQVRALP